MLNIKKRPDVGILLLRLTVGFVFIMHGTGKLFGVGPFPVGISGFAGALTLFGGAATFLAVVVALVETLGGLALILGMFTGIASLLLAIEMVIALLIVHFPNGFYATAAELPLLLLAATLAILFIGPGKILSFGNK